MLDALQRIETLLRAYGHTYEANLAAIAQTRFACDPLAGCRAVNNDEWWDDQHSLAAIDLAIDGGFTAQARSDAQTLRAALIEVYTTMLAYGERHPTGELEVAQFRKWMESHI